MFTTGIAINFKTMIICLTVYLVLYLTIVLVSLTGDRLLKLARPTAAIQYGIAASDSTIHGLIGGLSWAMLAVLQLGLSTSSSSLSHSQSLSPSTVFNKTHRFSTKEYLSLPALRDILLCALISTFIDLDHLLAARSFSIQSLTSLNRRPIFHNTSLLLGTSIVLLFLGHLCSLSSLATTTSAVTFTRGKSLSNSLLNSSGKMSWSTRLGYLLLMATLTHHIRDGLRRGLNFWPLPIYGNHLHSTPPVPLWLYFALLPLFSLAIHVSATHFSGRQWAFGYAASIFMTDNSLSSFQYSLLDPEAPPTVETVV